MFFKNQTKNNPENSESKKCEATLAYLQVIAGEKCRLSALNGSHNDMYIWGKNACKDASKTVVEQTQECLDFIKKP